MKYSIIIPVLNEEKVILNLLNQISDEKLKQKYDYEIIISDGGSTDSTLSIVLPYADKILVHTENSYQRIAGGRNKGAEAAEGDFLVFINGDIAFQDPDLFFSFLEKEFIYSDFAAFTCDVDINPDEKTFTDKIFIGFYNRYFHFLNIIGIGMGRGECHVVRKDIFKLLNGNNPRIAAGEDFELFTRIRRKGKILYANEIRIYESPRRYRKKGHLYILFSWLINSISVILFGKSVSRKWHAVR